MKHFMLSILTVLVITLGLLTRVSSVRADDKIAGAAGMLAMHVVKEDERVITLQKFLKQYNSPLAVLSAHFIQEADRLHLDWKLVASIAGVESSFGKRVPPDSYNGWGWGIPTGAQRGIGFASWEEGITTVSEGLAKYQKRGAITPEQIGRTYAADPTWAGKVLFFMQKIDGFAPTNPSQMEVVL